MCRQISRDPFARTELHASRVPAHHATCRECGQVKYAPNGAQYLNQYRIESDGGRVSEIAGLFCSVSCMRSYHS